MTKDETWMIVLANPGDILTILYTDETGGGTTLIKLPIGGWRNFKNTNAGHMSAEEVVEGLRKYKAIWWIS